MMFEARTRLMKKSYLFNNSDPDIKEFIQAINLIKRICTTVKTTKTHISEAEIHPTCKSSSTQQSCGSCSSAIMQRTMNCNENQKSDVSDRWIHQSRRNSNLSWACIPCPEQKAFAPKEVLWEHAQSNHPECPGEFQATQSIATYPRDMRNLEGQYEGNVNMFDEYCDTTVMLAMPLMAMPIPTLASERHSSLGKSWSRDQSMMTTGIYLANSGEPFNYSEHAASLNDTNHTAASSPHGAYASFIFSSGPDVIDQRGSGEWAQDPAWGVSPLPHVPQDLYVLQ